ncbi:hypothetical protein CIG75_18870 [Tumebacillus algifaecis]|uniref:Uncharacterized protein n=2 Tax=Tumebacillus algifaecis TaxID=1214604 RepID=A0A223D5C2_9BACL|nr:hypothetical protein CIG75_18870 [Tumebacillus algifaecis]
MIRSQILPPTPMIADFPRELLPQGPLGKPIEPDPIGSHPSMEPGPTPPGFASDPCPLGKYLASEWGPNPPGYNVPPDPFRFGAGELKHPGRNSVAPPGPDFRFMDAPPIPYNNVPPQPTHVGEVKPGTPDGMEFSDVPPDPWSRYSQSGPGPLECGEVKPPDPNKVGEFVGPGPSSIKFGEIIPIGPNNFRFDPYQVDLLFGNQNPTDPFISYDPPGRLSCGEFKPPFPNSDHSTNSLACDPNPIDPFIETEQNPPWPFANKLPLNPPLH